MASHRPPDTSMSDILLSPLTDLQTLSHALFASLSASGAQSSRSAPPVPDLRQFAAIDGRLAEAVNLAHLHQVKQRRIESLKREIVEMELRWREVCRELEHGMRELETCVEEGEQRIKGMNAANQADISYDSLLSYAQSLSLFTSAPPNMSSDPNMAAQLGLGQPPPPLFFPPFPNEEKMHRGRLDAEAPLGGLGETRSVGGPPGLDAIVSPELHAHGANPYRHDIHTAQPGAPDFDLDLDLNPDL